MKLILTSSGIEQEEIFKKVLDMVGKPANEISVAVINEASAVEEGDKRWLIDGIAYLSKTFGGDIDVVNLLALDLIEVKKRLKKADLIFCFGGSTEWLKIVFDKTGFSSILSDILKDKVWIGSSAGSMILGEMPSKQKQDLIYGITNYFGVNKYLNFVHFSILPHIFGDFVPKEALNVCLEESKIQDYPVYALSDSSAVVVEGNNISLVGENGYKLFDGHIIEQV